MITQTVQQKLVSKLNLLKAGDVAPDFSLPDQENKIHTRVHVRNILTYLSIIDK